MWKETDLDPSIGAIVISSVKVHHKMREMKY